MYPTGGAVCTLLEVLCVHPTGGAVCALYWRCCVCTLQEVLCGRNIYVYILNFSDVCTHYFIFFLIYIRRLRPSNTCGPFR